jgi:hypothetical protein
MVGDYMVLILTSDKLCMWSSVRRQTLYVVEQSESRVGKH